MDRDWVPEVELETQGLIMSIIACANLEGYSAVSALMKVPSGRRLPRKSWWSV